MKTFRNVRRKCRAITISDNTVDKDVQSVFLPLNLMQCIVFHPKYRIKHNVISPNSFISNFMSMIATLMVILLFIYFTYNLYYNEDLGSTTFMYVTGIYDFFFYFSGFTLNVVQGMVHTKKSVKFVLTFQKVHRVMNCQASLNNFIIWNWIIVIVVLSGHFSGLFIYCKLTGLPYAGLFICYAVIIFDVNILCAIRILKLLEDEVALWSIYVLNPQHIQGTHGENHIRKVYQAYVDLLKCYDIHKKCFQQLILFYIIELFTHALIYLQVSIDSFKTDFVIEDAALSIWGVLAIISWFLKDLAYLTMLSKQCEKFYVSIERAQDSCAQILLSNCSDEHKKLCKNVLRYHRASFSKIRVCGLFYLDAVLQLSLMSLLTNYIVVLLQLAIS